MTGIEVSPTGESCGATVTGIDLSQPVDNTVIEQIRAAWLQHHVLVFPQQTMTDDDLERFTLYFGEFGDDPFILPIEGRKHIISVQRLADETAPVFAEAWHTDWSFQPRPPAGTCLYSLKIPPSGGDTLFINQQQVLLEMPDALRNRLNDLQAIHSAQLAYHPDGAYGKGDRGRSMDIRASEDAGATQCHPLIKRHPETGELAVFGCAGYVIGIDGLERAESDEVLMELYQWKTQPRFQYRHQWQENMLLIWDNRSLLHKATGGYDGHERRLHRTTIADVT